MFRALVLLIPSLSLAATGVVNGDGSAPDAAALEAAAFSASLGDARPLALDAPGWAVAVATFTACTTDPTGSLADALATGRQLVDELSSAKAIALLRAAIDGLPCSSSPSTREQLLAALELLGQAAQDEGRSDAAADAYRQLLAADPAHQLSTPPGTGYDALFADVRREVNTLRPSQLTVQHIEGAAVTWDGAPVAARSALSMPALPGRHLLQWWESGASRGAWVDVRAAEVAVVSGLSTGPGWLLTEGPSDAAKQLALTVWLRDVATANELDALAVIQEPGRGYTVTDAITPWAGRAPPARAATTPLGPELRLAVGGGYALIQGFHFGEVTGALDVRLVGPLHLRIDGSLGLSPIDLGDPALGTVAALPGVGAGVAVHPPTGPVQPFGALVAGVYVTPTSEATAAAQQAAIDGGDDSLVARVQARGPVSFRGFLDGGVDLLPGDGPLVIRIAGGVGFGLGFQLRAGAQVGFRL